MLIISFLIIFVLELVIGISNENERLRDGMTSGEPTKLSLDNITPRNIPLTNVTSTSSSLPTTSTPDLEISSYSEEVRDINNQTPSQNLHKSGNDTVFEGQERNSFSVIIFIRSIQRCRYHV